MKAKFEAMLASQVAAKDQEREDMRAQMQRIIDDLKQLLEDEK